MGSAMTDHPWVTEFPAAITVVDTDGVILEMNHKSAVTFASDGGAELIGKNSLECHPEPSRSKLRQLLREQRANLYTIEKAGVKKLIAQIPWYQDGKFSGMVELAVEIPAEMPHFVRD
jgi:transcriptional regulator with PAS, ATPase and Fis domain